MISIKILYYKYTYDNFNCIATAYGSWTGDPMNTLGNKASNYTLEMAYENMHRITTKQQEHTRDASNVGENTYDNLFKYEDVNHPNAVTSIENQTNSDVEEFNYDANDDRTIPDVLVRMKHDSASSERTAKAACTKPLEKDKTNSKLLKYQTPEASNTTFMMLMVKEH